MTEKTDIATVQNDVKWIKGAAKIMLVCFLSLPVTIGSGIWYLSGHVKELDSHKAIDTIMHKQLDTEILELKGTLRDVVEIKILEQLGDIDASKKLEVMRKEWEPPPPIYAVRGGEEA